jgi:hypothetical protein
VTAVGAMPTESAVNGTSYNFTFGVRIRSTSTRVVGDTTEMLVPPLFAT